MAMEKILAVFEKPIYMAMEPHDPHLLHVAFGVVSSGVKVNALLRDSGVNYAVAAQHLSSPKLLGQPLIEIETAPHRVLELMMKNKATVSVVKEDLASRGLTEKDLIPNVNVISASEVPALIEQHDSTFVW